MKACINHSLSKTRLSLWSSEPRRSKTLIILRQTTSKYRDTRTKDSRKTIKGKDEERGTYNTTGPRSSLQKVNHSDVYENETVIVKALRAPTPEGILPVRTDVTPVFTETYADHPRRLHILGLRRVQIRYEERV